MNPSQQTSLQVRDTLDILVRHWNQGDISGFLSHTDTECSGIGTSSDGPFRGSDEFRRFLETETGILKGLGLSESSVDAIGTISWITGTFHALKNDGRTITGGRFSMVLKGTGHAWVLVHLHLSCPAG